MADWCILRTSGRFTLRLAASLASDGLDVWTPIETKRIQNTRRDIKLPLMPSYVFVKARHIVDLLQLVEAKKRQATRHAEFSLMRGPGHGIVGVADAHLHALRSLEQKRTPRRRAAKLPQGVTIRVKAEGGSFAGMTGRVIRSGEQATLAILDGRMKVELPTFMFSEIDVRTGQVVLPRAA